MNRTCQDCGAFIPESQNDCVICGGYPEENEETEEYFDYLNPENRD